MDDKIEVLFQGGPLDGRKLDVRAGVEFVEVPVELCGIVRYQIYQETLPDGSIIYFGR
jgi:hypothetical protein